MAILKEKIIPHLWFGNQAEDAVNFYVSVFKKSKIRTVVRYGKSGSQASGMPEGSIMTIFFQIEGQDFMALNGGPAFKFNESISLMIFCKDQKELDYYWDKLSEGGDEKSQICGWLKDKYGLSWQIVPADLEKMMKNKNPEKIEKIMEVLVKMKKIDIPTLKEAYAD